MQCTAPFAAMISRDSPLFRFIKLKLRVFKGLKTTLVISLNLSFSFGRASDVLSTFEGLHYPTSKFSSAAADLRKYEECRGTLLTCPEACNNKLAFLNLLVSPLPHYRVHLRAHLRNGGAPWISPHCLYFDPKLLGRIWSEMAINIKNRKHAML